MNTNMNQKLMYAVLILASVIGFMSVPALGVRTVCVICSSEDNENCIGPPSGMNRYECGDQVCFTRMENGYVVRGCGVYLPTDARANCTGGNSYCEMCINKIAIIPCNNKVFPEPRLSCHQCRGHINTSCGQVPLTNPTLCPLFSSNDRCFTRRHGEIIVRGCESSHMCSDGRSLFCSGNGCNMRIGTDPDIPYSWFQ